MNFAWLPLGAGLSLARTALSASGRLLSSVIADDNFIVSIIAKKAVAVKQNQEQINVLTHTRTETEFFLMFG